MKPRARGLALLLVAGALGCGDKPLTERLDEPFALRGAQFIEGELPGSPPSPEGQPPQPTAATSETTQLRPGLANVTFFGWATEDAVAIAARLEGQGSGYWVLPTGPTDPAVPGSRVWRFDADLRASLPPGPHRLLVAATDAAGRSGTQVATGLCVQRAVPDNGNACDPKKAPPEFVINLSWDRPVDLDLIVVTPKGDVISSRNPAAGLAADATPINRRAPENTPPGVGYLDEDANHGCVIDGRQAENVVFQNTAPKGTYLVFATLVDTCGQSTARYLATRYVRAQLDAAAGTFTVAEAERASGSVIALQANGGASFGTFVTEFVVP